MKKSIIAMAVAGALAVPAIASADATLYGTVAADGVFKNDTSADIEVDDMVVGLKGTVDLGLDGVTGFFNFRTEFSAEGNISAPDSSVTTDRALVGITGSFGTVQAGAMGNPVDAVESLDVLANGYTSANGGDPFQNPDDLQSAFAYVSPTMGGFTGYAGLVMDGGTRDTATTSDKDVDGYLLGFNYAIGGLTADVGYWKFDQNGKVGADFDFIGLSLDYSISDNWSATLNWQETDNTTSLVETETWGLGTHYTIGNTTLGLVYVDFDSETGGVKNNNSFDEWAITASHKLGNRAKIYAQYSDADLDDSTVSDAGTRALNIGYSISF